MPIILNVFITIVIIRSGSTQPAAPKELPHWVKENRVSTPLNGSATTSSKRASHNSVKAGSRDQTRVEWTSIEISNEKRTSMATNSLSVGNRLTQFKKLCAHAICRVV